MSPTKRAIQVACAVVVILAALLGPWVTIQRSMLGGQSTIATLTGQITDFTGRLPAGFPGLPGYPSLMIIILAGASLALASALIGRRWWWLGSAAGSALIGGATLTSLGQLQEAVAEGRLVAGEFAFRNAGASFGSGFAMIAAFLLAVLAVSAIPALERRLTNLVRAITVPLIAIGLSLLIGGAAVMAIRPVPTSGGVEVETISMLIFGKLAMVWTVYELLTTSVLSDPVRIAEALRAATPLIFTGLAVAFGFRAGLFNIGAPGQLVMGAILAALAGIYLPGPSWVVIPLAILAAALGGAIWGAIPGYLKARFGAHEVINTILMNQIAQSIMLFILTDRSSFSLAALYVLAAGVIGVLYAIAVLAGRPATERIAAIGVTIGVAVVMIFVLGLTGRTITTSLPFRAPGFELRTLEIRPEARLPSMVSILRLEEGPGTLNLAPWWPLALAGAGALLYSRSLRTRLAGAGAGLAAGLLIGLATPLGNPEVVIPRALAVNPLSSALLIALVMAVLVGVLLWRTTLGYELRATGLAPKAAEYGGVNIFRNTILTMAISGALAGLSATHFVLGGALDLFALRQAIPIRVGFDGITVALLGQNTPIGAVLASLLYGVLIRGGLDLNLQLRITPELIAAIQSLVIVFIAVRSFLPRLLTRPVRFELAQPKGTAASGPATGEAR